MQQRLENSTLIALRELRGYEQERQSAERRKKEEEVHEARERKERERQVEEAARERALEKQLQTDLRRAEEEIRCLRQEADRRTREATQALQSLVSVPRVSAPSILAPAARRGRWLAVSGYTTLLASALVLLIVLRRDSSPFRGHSQREPLCPASVASPRSPTSVTGAPATAVVTSQATLSSPLESGKQRPPTPHSRSTSVQRPIRKPNPPKPTCDGTDPLCGLEINSIAP